MCFLKTGRRRENSMGETRGQSLLEAARRQVEQNQQKLQAAEAKQEAAQTEVRLENLKRVFEAVDSAGGLYPGEHTSEPGRETLESIAQEPGQPRELDAGQLQELTALRQKRRRILATPQARRWKHTDDLKEINKRIFQLTGSSE